jgi:hypothetical protein
MPSFDICDPKSFFNYRHLRTVIKRICATPFPFISVGFCTHLATGRPDEFVKKSPKIWPNTFFAKLI